MSAVYENEKKQVCVQLVDNDFIIITNFKKEEILKITSKNGRIIVENINEETNSGAN